MEPKLVYRCLRQLSVWVTDNYYSDVVVEGAENVPETGPVILAATHRNESIDVAVLAVTIPHGRQVSYWAKSSLFKQPVLRWIMNSSGAIPVQRSAESARASTTTNSSSSTDNNNNAASQTQADLFRASTACLMRGGTLGVFPEGFSATLQGLGDLRSGAAWAAVEHDRAARLAALERGSPGRAHGLFLCLSSIRTHRRIRAKSSYGPAIKTADYYSTNAGEDDLEARKEAVARMMDAVRHTLQVDGINAPDWPTLHAAKVMLDFDYPDPMRTLGVRGWMLKMQGYVKYFSDENTHGTNGGNNETVQGDHGTKQVDNETKQVAKAILARYRALQIHTQISYADLSAFVPPNHPLAIIRPFLAGALLAFLQASARTILCLPPLVVYLPAYVASYAATAVLTRRDQPESHAQVSAIAGGFGLGLGFWGASVTIKRLYRPVFGRLFQRASRGLTAHAGPSLSRYISLFAGSRVGRLAMGYVALKTLMAWHNHFAEGNRRIFRRCVASANILLAIMFPGYEETSLVYDSPPVIAENAHARRKAKEGEDVRRKEAQKGEDAPRRYEGKADYSLESKANGGRPWKFTLVRRLVAARREAMHAWDLLQGDEGSWRMSH